MAELEGRIVATVQFDCHKGHLHVIGLAVHPRYQHRGIARRLLDRIADRAEARGHERVVLDTIKETGNVPVFEKLGFHVVQEYVATCFVSDVFAELHEVRMARRVAVEQMIAE